MYEVMAGVCLTFGALLTTGAINRRSNVLVLLAAAANSGGVWAIGQAVG